MAIWHHGEGNSISNLVISPDMKKAKASIVTMIKAASSRAILLIFSSFLQARAVGVV